MTSPHLPHSFSFVCDCCVSVVGPWYRRKTDLIICNCFFKLNVSMMDWLADALEWFSDFYRTRRVDDLHRKDSKRLLLGISAPNFCKYLSSIMLSIGMSAPVFLSWKLSTVSVNVTCTFASPVFSIFASDTAWFPLFRRPDCGVAPRYFSRQPLHSTKGLHYELVPFPIDRHWRRCSSQIGLCWKQWLINRRADIIWQWLRVLWWLKICSRLAFLIATCLLRFPVFLLCKNTISIVGCFL